MDLLQGVIDVSFKGILVYLSPTILIFAACLLADRLIDTMHHALINNKEKRRYRVR